jgi:quinol monooxygenase YgiN
MPYTEDAMHARVSQLHVRPGKVQDFQEILSSLVELARQHEGYRGVLALASGKSESPDVTLVALWDSLEAMRVSEDNLFDAGNRTLSGLLRRLPAHHRTGAARKRFHRNQCPCQGVRRQAWRL